MIKIGNIRQIKDDYDENWLIVRSAKSIPNHAKQVKELSPEPGLFYAYLDAKKAGCWNQAWFDEHYVPRFLRDIKANPKAIELLNDLYRASRTKDIFLCCYCPDEKLCHRSIIAGLLLGAGANIECNPDYIKYWDMFKAL